MRVSTDSFSAKEGVSCNQSNSLSFAFAKPANLNLVLTERAHSRIHYESYDWQSDLETNSIKLGMF